MNNNLIWSKAPLRLGLAGGGTDVSPFSESHGGCVLNSTINLYSYSTIELLVKGKIIFESFDLGFSEAFDLDEEIKEEGPLILLKGVYNYLKTKFNLPVRSFHLSTFVDAPPGSGLGSSSTLVVSIIGAFVEMYNLPLGEYEIAHEAYIIERIKLGMAGGKQDQYAATFGGFNFIEFGENDKVIVNPLRIKEEIINTLEVNLLLYFVGTSRVSSELIEKMQVNVKQGNKKSLDSLIKVKEQAILMKESLLTSNLKMFGKILSSGWEHKKQISSGISNKKIDEIYNLAINSGAEGGRVSGAGGGGFMLFYCPKNSKHSVVKEVAKTGGHFRTYQFVKRGLTVWRI